MEKDNFSMGREKVRDEMDNLDETLFGSDSELEQAAMKQWRANHAMDHGTSKSVRGRLFDNRMVIIDTIPQCIPVAIRHLEEDIAIFKEQLDRLKKCSEKKRTALAVKLKWREERLAYLLKREPCHLERRGMCIYMERTKGTRGNRARRTEKCMAMMSYLAVIREEVITEYVDMDQEGMLIVGTQLIPALLLESRIQIQIPAMDLTTSTDRGGIKANPLLKELRSTTEHIEAIRETLRLRMERLRNPESEGGLR